MSSVSPPVVAWLDVTAARRLVANMLEHAVRDPHWHEQPPEEVPQAREENSPPSYEPRLSVSTAIADGARPPSAREYRTSICPAGESRPLGMVSRARREL